MRRILRKVAWLLLPAASLFLACGAPTNDAESVGILDFQRILREGVEQIRRHRVALGRASLEKCRLAKPDDPGLLFHLSRLELLDPGDTAEVDIPEALNRLLELQPDSVRAHMLLAGLYTRREAPDAAKRHHGHVVRHYGRLGALEIGLRSLIQKEGLQRAPDLVGRYSGDSSPAGEVAAAFSELRHQGKYDPEKGFKSLERILTGNPDLAAIRIVFAKALVMGQIRLSTEARDDLPALSSRMVLDYAQSHLEKTFDLVDPRSRIAQESLYWLAQVAYRMGDYDDAGAHTDLLLEQYALDDSERRRLIGLKGFGKLRRSRPGEAATLFESALLQAPPGFTHELPIRWLLHLAHEDMGSPPGATGRSFEFREGIELAAGGTDMSFTDEAPKLGIDKLDGLGPSAWGDFDQDGDFDLFVTGCDSYGALYRNNGANFSEVSREAGLFHVQSGFSATFADYDNDGFPDLYVGRDGWNGPAPNSLYRNKGDGSFEDVTSEAGLGDQGSTFVHAWSDIDRDGDLDLFLANGITGSGDTNRLYINNGDGTFSDETLERGLAEAPGTKTIGVAIGDYDGNGWPDIFLSGFFAVNRLYRNKGDGTFEEVATAAGVDGSDHKSTGYVSFFVDFDNDLKPDILRTVLAEWKVVLEDLSGRLASAPPGYRVPVLRHLTPKLYRNLGDGSFKEVAAKAGLGVVMGVMGANTGDLNNDGYMDLYFGTGDPEVDRLEPDRMFRGNGNGIFQDHTFASGLGNVGKGHGVTMIDLDHDGDLEIYVPEGGFVHGDPWANALYMNHQRTGNRWLHLDLVGVLSNRDAVDTKVIARMGEMTVLREVKNGEGFGSSNSPTVEIGLGRAAKVDLLEIKWPSGTVQRFRNVEPNRRLVIVEGEGPVPWPGAITASESSAQ